MKEEAEKKSSKKEKKQPFVPTDGLTRCFWCQGSEIYVNYHDKEWGVPVRDDKTLFEYLSLEGAQAGLSWITILNKREDYRAAFHNFDVARCATLSEAELEAVLSKNVVKHRAKVWSVRGNAQRTLEVQKEFGSLSKYLWGFVKAPSGVSPSSPEAFRTTSPESEALSKDLKKRGFLFVGPTIMYAFMQAVGMVNDHTPSCFRHDKVKS